MEYDIGGDESVSTAVVRVVSAFVGREPSSLQPLADVVDPTALDALFDSQSDGTPRTGGRLSFVYNDCLLTIQHDEYLTLEMLEGRLSDERDRGPADGCIC